MDNRATTVAVDGIILVPSLLRRTPFL